jgi:hypothetical protein
LVVIFNIFFLDLLPSNYALGMRKQDYLVELIHSLTPGEKRYFRQYISSGDDSKNYGKLFDILQKSESYDADALSRELKKSKKNLADDKEYLQEILLRSLNGFHSPSMYKARVFNGMIESDILAAKGMMKFALAHTRKLKKGMLSGEENLLYYQVLAQEINLYTAITPGALKADEWVKNSIEELVLRLDACRLNIKLMNLSTLIQDLSADIKYIENKAVQKEAKALMEEAVQLAKGKNLSSRTLQTYHNLMAEYYFFLGVNTKLSVEHIQKAIDQYESETEQFKQFNTNLYLDYLLSLLNGYFELRQYDEVERGIKKLHDLTGRKISKQIQIKAERRIFHFSVLIYTATGEHEKALAFIGANIATYKKLTSTAEDHSLVQLLKAINLFHLQRYDEALSELLPLLSSDAPSQLPETRISARALNLMIQYEIGNLASLPNYLRAAQRFFTNEGLMTREVKLFLGLMRHLHKHGARAPLAQFQKNFETVYGAHRFEIIGYFVIWPWLTRLAKSRSPNI